MRILMLKCLIVVLAREICQWQSAVYVCFSIQLCVNWKLEHIQQHPQSHCTLKKEWNSCPAYSVLYSAFIKLLKLEQSINKIWLKKTFYFFHLQKGKALTTLLFTDVQTFTFYWDFSSPGSCLKALWWFLIPPPLHSRCMTLKPKDVCVCVCVCVCERKIQISSRAALPTWQMKARPPAPHLRLLLEEWLHFTPALHSSSLAFSTSTFDPSIRSVAATPAAIATPTSPRQLVAERSMLGNLTSPGTFLQGDFSVLEPFLPHHVLISLPEGDWIKYSIYKTLPNRSLRIA